jgi:hypothetical protein
MPAQSAREAAEPIAAEAKVALRASGFIQKGCTAQHGSVRG